MRDLLTWINTLPWGVTVRRATWIIPLMQTVHILAIGMIMASIVMMDLRVWGLARSQTLVESTRRHAPWIWAGMILLTLTGFVLVMGLSRRQLYDATFEVKMQLMAVAILATLGFEGALRWKGAVWERARGVHWIAGLLAAATLILWISVTLAGRGRWIAGFLR
jgi:hypothetical protein